MNYKTISFFFNTTFKGCNSNDLADYLPCFSHLKEHDFFNLFVFRYSPNDHFRDDHDGIAQSYEDIQQRLPFLLHRCQSKAEHNRKHNHTQDVHLVVLLILKVPQPHILCIYKERKMRLRHTWPL